MSTTDFLIIWALSFIIIFACRAIPIFVLRGRALPPRVVEGLGYIPPAAFAALVANDLVSSTMFDAGIWAGLIPIAASAVVVAVAAKTRSLMWCCIAGIAAFLVLSLI